MALKDELGLTEGQELINHKSSLKGSMGNIDIDEYDIVELDGTISGSIKITVDTNIKAPNRQTRKVERFTK